MRETLQLIIHFLKFRKKQDNPTIFKDLGNDKRLTIH